MLPAEDSLGQNKELEIGTCRGRALKSDSISSGCPSKIPKTEQLQPQRSGLENLRSRFLLIWFLVRSHFLAWKRLLSLSTLKWVHAWRHMHTCAHTHSRREDVWGFFSSHNEDLTLLSSFNTNYPLKDPIFTYYHTRG